MSVVDDAADTTSSPGVEPRSPLRFATIRSPWTSILAAPTESHSHLEPSSCQLVIPNWEHPGSSVGGGRQAASLAIHDDRHDTGNGTRDMHDCASPRPDRGSRVRRDDLRGREGRSRTGGVPHRRGTGGANWDQDEDSVRSGRVASMRGTRGSRGSIRSTTGAVK